ncbi:MAG: DUF2510 domain-containing protein [Solirubrobacteraceae bacterium]
MSDIPAGWQPDPRGRHEYRYWDGTQWTDHVSNQGKVSSDPVADAAPAASDSEKSAIFKPDPTPTAGETEAAPAASASERSEVGSPTASEEPTSAREEQTVVSEPRPIFASERTDVTPTPTPASTAGASVPSSAPPAGTTTEPATAQTGAKAAAQDLMKSRSPELATILSAVVPGSGHFYTGTNKVPLAAGLLVATLAAVVISHISFLFFLIGFAIWAGAAAFALTDLRGGVRGIENTVLPKNVVGILLIGAGALLVLSLLLPYYRVSADAGPLGSVSESGSAFQFFSIIDIVLLVIGVVSIAAGAASLGLGPATDGELPPQLPLAVAIGGAIATALILFRMFVDPVPGLPSGFDADISIGRAFGIWLGLWSAMVLLLANLGLLRSLSNRGSSTTA